MAILGILLVIGSAIFSYLLNLILLRYSRSFGVNSTLAEGEIRWASTSKPTVGGFSFFIIFVLSALIFLLTTEGDGGMNGEFLGLLLCTTLGFLIGLQDDAYNTQPMLKLAGQLACGAIMIYFGVYIHLFDIPILDYAITLFWVAGVMNSINLLDNMDGVTGSVSLMILITALVLMHMYPGNLEQNAFYFTLLTATGGLIGFLILNWKPSKLYMGDTGSQFLGALLAFIGVKFFWNIGDMDADAAESMQIYVPVMAFIVPLMDTTFVFVNRIRQGRSPFQGGKDHLTHHIHHFGVSERYVPVLLSFIGMLSGLLAVFTVKFVLSWNHLYTLIFGVYVATMFIAFFLMFKKGERIGQAKDRFTRTFHRKVDVPQGDPETVGAERRHTT